MPVFLQKGFVLEQIGARRNSAPRWAAQRTLRKLPSALKQQLARRMSSRPF